jgi:hypothetical protein
VAAVGLVLGRHIRVVDIPGAVVRVADGEHPLGIVVSGERDVVVRLRAVDDLLAGERAVAVREGVGAVLVDLDRPLDQVIVGGDDIECSESKLMYEILNLNRSEFIQTYSTTSNSYPSGYDGGSSHYHTVVPDRYTLSRTDPGAYYDHYEYGDNYDIDDYLESEGYD